MIKVINGSREFTEVETYLMTISPAIMSMKDVPDHTIIEVDGCLTFIDCKDNGEETEVLSIITPDNKVYSCQSATFKRAINDISNIMHGGKFSVEKISGKTKAGRDFINCTLVI